MRVFVVLALFFVYAQALRVQDDPVSQAPGPAEANANANVQQLTRVTEVMPAAASLDLAKNQAVHQEAARHTNEDLHAVHRKLDSISKLLRKTYSYLTHNLPRKKVHRKHPSQPTHASKPSKHKDHTHSKPKKTQVKEPTKAHVVTKKGKKEQKPYLETKRKRQEVHLQWISSNLKSSARG